MAYTPQIYYPQSAYAPQYNYQQPQMMTPTQPPAPQPPAQTSNQGLIWVSGEVGAKSYLMTPNATVMLMDSDDSFFYLKSTDSSGMPTLRKFSYQEVTQGTQNTPQGAQTSVNNMSEQFVTREEYKALLGECNALKTKLEEMQKVRKKK